MIEWSASASEAVKVRKCNCSYCREISKIRLKSSLVIRSIYYRTYKPITKI